MFDEDEFQVLYSTEDYIRLTKRNQELENQNDSMKEQRTKMVEQLIKVKKQLNYLLKEDNKMKEKIKDISVTALGITRKMLEDERKIVITCEAGVMTSETQIESQLIIEKKNSSQREQQTEWSVIDERYFEQEIKKLQKDKKQVQKVLQQTNKEVMRLQIYTKQLVEKQKQTEAKNQQLDKVMKSMSHFIDERIFQNKKANANIDMMAKKILSQNQIIENLYKKIEKIENKGQSKSVEFGDVKNIIERYFSSFVMKHMEMSFQKGSVELNQLLNLQSQAIQKYIQDVCEAHHK